MRHIEEIVRFVYQNTHKRVWAIWPAPFVLGFKKKGRENNNCMAIYDKTPLRIFIRGDPGNESKHFSCMPVQ